MKRMSIENAVNALKNGGSNIDSAIVGVSGGPDSMVLLSLLASDPTISNLLAVHVNYGTSEVSDEAQKIVSSFCDEMDIPLKIYRVSISGSNFEARAREERMKVFLLNKEFSRNVFLGSNLDDQIETFFLKLKRGNGLRGLKAMNRISLIRDMVFFRPLLSFSKEEILEYAKTNNIPYVIDPTNSDTKYDRNFIRHEVLPLLEKRFFGFKRTMEKVVFSLNDAKFCLDDLAELDLKNVMEGDKLNIKAMAENLAIQRIRNMIQYYINKNNFSASYNDLISFTNMLLKVGKGNKIELSLKGRDFVNNDSSSKRYVLKQDGNYLSIVEAPQRKRR